MKRVFEVKFLGLKAIVSATNAFNAKYEMFISCINANCDIKGGYQDNKDKISVVRRKDLDSWGRKQKGINSVDVKSVINEKM